MKPGIYENISNAEYHGGPGISKSGLDLVRRSPLHYRAARDATGERIPTPAQAIGTAFHALLLEPPEFTRNYTLALRRSDVPEAIEDRDVLVGMVQELNAGRLAKLPTSGSKDEQVARILAAYAEGAAKGQDVRGEAAHTDVTLQALKGADLKAELNRLNESRTGLLPTTGTRHELATMLRDAGRPVTLWSDVMGEWNQKNGHMDVLAPEAWDQLMGMRNAVMDHPAASALISAPGRAELSVYWNDPVTGTLCRCRPDYLRDDGVVVDLKTCEDASLEGFAKSIAGWGYHTQAPYYLDGIELMRHQANRRDIAKPRAFVFLAVEKKPPYAVGVYVLDTESLELGRLEYRQALDLFASCERSGVWPGYGERIQTISLPGWKLRAAA